MTNSGGGSTSEIPENVNEAYRRMLLNAPSLLPGCEMPVARMLFAEWLLEEQEKGTYKVVNNTSNGNAQIDALRKREAALKEKIATAQVRQQKTRAKLQAREFATVGEALCKYAGQSAEFQLMLKQVLQTAVTKDAERKFLAERGWL